MCHRHVLAESRTLLGRTIATSVLTRDWGMLADLVRTHGARLARYRERLGAVARPLPLDGFDVQKVIRDDASRQAAMLPQWRHLIWDQDPVVRSLAELDGEKPLHRIEALGFRSNATFNAFAQWFSAQTQSAALIYADSKQIEEVMRTANKGIGPAGLNVVNPTGNKILAIQLRSGDLDDVGKMRDVSAFCALVPMQLDLVLDLSGHHGGNWRFPLEGEARAGDLFATKIHLDQDGGLLWFKSLAGAPWSRAIASRYNGRVAVPLK